MIIFENVDFYVERHESEIPWLKIFTKEPYHEIGDMPADLRKKMWELYDTIEYEMRHFYNPKKINMASFANILPRVHIHVMARFEDDSYYPNPVWGEKVREGNLQLPKEDEFFKRVFNALSVKER
ncbi:MAG: HIT domain-containing protein [Epsilonproteobacteria bacterium]|nr:HIT domain-containing protein [Campylobacterota bacterium]